MRRRRRRFLDARPLPRQPGTSLPAADPPGGVRSPASPCEGLASNPDGGRGAAGAPVHGRRRSRPGASGPGRCASSGGQCRCSRSFHTASAGRRSRRGASRRRPSPARLPPLPATARPHDGGTRRRGRPGRGGGGCWAPAGARAAGHGDQAVGRGTWNQPPRNFASSILGGHPKPTAEHFSVGGAAATGRK